jgi:hypothetical protein
VNRAPGFRHVPGDALQRELGVRLHLVEVVLDVCKVRDEWRKSAESTAVAISTNTSWEKSKFILLSFVEIHVKRVYIPLLSLVAGHIITILFPY